MEKGNEQDKKDLKQAYRTAYLVAGFIKQTLTEEEQEELDDWIIASEENMRLFGNLTDEKNIDQSLKAFEKMEVEEGLSATKKKLRFTRPRKTIRFWQYGIAASFIIAAGILLYIYQFSGKVKDKEIVNEQKTDMSPGSDKATLTLENGKVIVLEPGNDTLINTRIKILRNDGEIVYNSDLTGNEPVYHELTIPRKGQYRLTLPDGSKVWLNAESSIRYPTAFTGNERRVFVTGETFFEVAKDKSKPFRVVAGVMTVEAVGTQFNINAYPNEPFLTATLVEGSVLLSKGKTENILKPGQQAQLTHEDFRIVNTDVHDVMAWKNNQFKFTNTPIDAIMRQLERWYDAEVVYQDNVNIHLNATIERDVPVSKLLHILEETEQVHFKVEGKKIIVMK